jgi:hypothetical protein
MAGHRDFPAAAIDALTKAHKIEAIKIIRQEWAIDLKEAKDTVDTYVKARPDLASQFQEASDTGKKRLWLWLLALLAATLLYYSFAHRQLGLGQ